MDSRPEGAYGGDSPERRIFIALAAIVVLAVVFAGYRRYKKHKRPHRPHKALAVAPTVLPKVPEPKVAVPGELALEIWVKSPDELAQRIIPRLAPPGTPKSLATFTMMMKNGMPPERQKDVDELDFSKPLGIAVFEAGRFVAAATVKNATTAKQVIEAYATSEGAMRERSTALAVDMFKGAKTGRYLALVGNQVFLGSDRTAVESAVPRLAAGWPLASTQTHDVVARAPRSWVSGPFAQWAEKSWMDWIQPQLGGATSGPAKALFDEVSAAAKATWPGAEDVEMVLDVGEQTAHATATLRATPGSAFASFLGSYPTRTPTALLEAPRDALGGLSLRFPPSWLTMIRKFMVTPPPGQEIPPELRAKTDAVFGDLERVLDGEVLFTSVADPPQSGGAGASLVRFKVKEDEAAKKAAKELMLFMLAGPPGTPPPPMAPITIEGGAGEAMEIDIPVQPGTPPMPKAGIAWVVRAGYLYIARGSNPRQRVLHFASPKPEDHAQADGELRARIEKLPQAVGLAAFMAPFRADAPLAAALQVPPALMVQAITASIAPTANGVTIHGAFDLDLTLEMVKPLLMAPPPGAAPPPGSLPPDAASGMPPGHPPPGVPPGMMPGVPIPMPKPGGGGATPKSPPQGAPPPVPPAPTGYVLPLPKHETGH